MRLIPKREMLQIVGREKLNGRPRDSSYMQWFAASASIPANGRLSDGCAEMMPRWAVPLAWILLCLAIGTVLAILLTGCQMPLRT